MITVLIAEDDKNIRQLFKSVLELEGYQTLEAANGREALELLESETIELLVIDIMMPELDGYQTIARIRETNSLLPIIIVTSKETPADKKQGFVVGTDDYITKPVDFDEFILRIKALLRRAKVNTEGKLVVHETVLNLNDLCVSRNHQQIELPKKEFLLLYKLLSFPNTIFTREQLLNDIWGIDSLTDERTVDVHIKRLREKFIDFPDFSIVTIRGLGYKGVYHETE